MSAKQKPREWLLNQLLRGRHITRLQFIASTKTIEMSRVKTELRNLGYDVQTGRKKIGEKVRPYLYIPREHLAIDREWRATLKATGYV